MFPREHGAWSLLLTPFAAGLLIAWHWNGTIVAALCAAVATFLLRAPLIAIARQRWVWRDARPEAAEARRWLVWLAPALAAAGGWLLLEWGAAATLGIGAGAIALTLAAVWMTLRNRQRSPWFQVLSCAGLTFSCVAAARAACGAFPAWSWILWALSALHGAAGIFAVHARLDAIVASKRGAAAPAARRPAWMAAALSAAAAAALLSWDPWLALAPALSAVAQAFELRNMDLSTPLKRVGLRAMSVSIAHALILVAVLRLHR